jgi:Fe-S cluster assembly protein SufB
MTTEKKKDDLERIIEKEYEHGFVTEIDEEIISAGLNEDVIRLISKKKNEPNWMLEWRLKAYRHWLKLGAA